jgi:phosphoribosylformimino-5-aminoimidazole carboxamide ribotide isomerase
MILIPAIDIKGGNVVRLFQGDFDKLTDYGPYPVMAAYFLYEMGAQWFHLVDLDGAKSGIMGNKKNVISITEQFLGKVSVEVGGGIRDSQTVDDLIKAGVKRIILGTKAIEDRNFLKDMLELHGDKICVSLDCSNGFVAERGWVSTTDIKATDLALEFEGMGLQWMVYTDIARDGTLTGPNFDQLQTMLDTVKKMNIIASGGVSSLEDVIKLKDLRSKEGKQLWGAISGKAIYDRKLDFKKALEALK